MTAEANKAAARGYYERIDREGPDAGKPSLGEGYAYRGPNHTGFDSTGPGSLARRFYEAFPDFTHEVVDQVAAGDLVCERIRYTATHMAEFMGVPATGARVAFTGMDWVRFRDGKIVARWGVSDDLGLRAQLLAAQEEGL